MNVVSAVIAAVVVAPLATGVVEPILLSIAKEAVFVVVHESVEELPEVTDVGEAVRVQMGAGSGGGGGGVTGTTCWFLKTTAAHVEPLCTFTFPFAGVTDKSSQVPPGSTSVIWCAPGVTELNRALPLASVCTVTPPSSVKVNWATGVILAPLGSKVSFKTSIQPFVGGGVDGGGEGGGG